MADDWIRLELSLDSFDERPFMPFLERSRAAGVQFTTFADLDDGVAARRKLYELNRECSRDIPRRGAFYSFDEYVAERIGVPSFAPDGVIIALDDGDWVGMCALSTHLEQGQMFIEMTGVRGSYRRRGIWLAMKVLTIRWAKAAGATTIGTVHHHDNVPAIRANEKLGFRPLHDH